jgi:hypothetical protein
MTQIRGYQFVHIEGYSRKGDANGRSVDYVLSEAERRPGNCPHVTSPGPPETIFGMDLTELRPAHDARADAARTTIAGGKTRRIRIDQLTLLTVVASHPATVAETRASPAVLAEVAAWEARVLDWLRVQWDDDLASVVRHTDETYCHLHAYVLPSDPEMRARRLHPGANAKAAAKANATADGLDAKTANAAGDAAYKHAMRLFQNEFWQSVGIACGLARRGPARRRLSRAAWQTEKAAAAAAAETIRLADEAAAKTAAAEREALQVYQAAEAERVAAAMQRAEAEAAAARAAAATRAAQEQVARANAEARAAKLQRNEAERQAATLARSGKTLIERARGEAKQIVQAAETEGMRLRRRARSIGAWFGAVFHGLLGSAPAIVAKTAAEKARTEERDISAALLKSVRAEASETRRQLAETRQRLASVSAAVVAVGSQRDHLARELDRVRPAPSPVRSPAPRPH